MNENIINEDLLKLKKKLESLNDYDLYKYVENIYGYKPLCCKKSLLIRYIINLERDKINKNIIN